MYGLIDKKLKVLKKNFLPELEAHYRDMGPTEVVRIPDVGHSLNKEGKDFQYESGKLPKITYKIVTFLNQYLGRGINPVGPQAKFFTKEQAAEFTRKAREEQIAERARREDELKNQQSRGKEPVSTR